MREAPADALCQLPAAEAACLEAALLRVVEASGVPLAGEERMRGGRIGHSPHAAVAILVAHARPPPAAGGGIGGPQILCVAAVGYGKVAHGRGGWRRCRRCRACGEKHARRRQRARQPNRPARHHTNFTSAYSGWMVMPCLKSRSVAGLNAAITHRKQLLVPGIAAVGW